MAELLTKPEQATERALAKRLRARVTAAGGCAYCRHRVEGWGKAACDTAGRVFPRCLATPGKQFELDQTAVQGTSTCTSES